jgi:hypothetical protein
MPQAINIDGNSSDLELMTRFHSLRQQACGEEIGSSDQTPAEAVASEGWTLVRHIYRGTNCPGTPVLAEDAAGRLWVVADLDGPWGIIADVEL